MKLLTNFSALCFVAFLIVLVIGVYAKSNVMCYGSISFAVLGFICLAGACVNDEDTESYTGNDGHSI